MATSARLLKVGLVLSSLTICLGAGEPDGGCAHLRKEAPAQKAAVRLPAAPKFMAPIAKPAVKAGDDARVAFRNSDAALDDANRRLTQTRGWYLSVRKRYQVAPLK